MFGSLVKQYHLKQTADKADWLIGEGLLAAGINGKGCALSMSEPGTAYDDPLLGRSAATRTRSFIKTRRTAAHPNSGIPNPGVLSGRDGDQRSRLGKSGLYSATQFAIAIWRRMQILRPS